MHRPPYLVTKPIRSSLATGETAPIPGFQCDENVQITKAYGRVYAGFPNNLSTFSKFKLNFSKIEFYFSENQTSDKKFPYRVPAPLLTPFPLSIHFSVVLPLRSLRSPCRFDLLVALLPWLE